MTSRTRLRLSLVMIMMSVIYGLILLRSPQAASAIALGYVALVLTAFLLANLWKKP